MLIFAGRDVGPESECCPRRGCPISGRPSDGVVFHHPTAMRLSKPREIIQQFIHSPAA